MTKTALDRSNHDGAEVAVYVHVPFCPSKCGYCDFNSYAMTGTIIERTVDAIEREILQSPWRGMPAKTIFFGGGTPTFLDAPQLIRLFDAVVEAHPPVDGCEITSEANPGTVDASKFAAMRQAGFNRISLGAQSFQDDDLLRLERIHKARDIEKAVRAAREAGFENINVDLMFALPSQAMVGWERNLERAIALETEHLSLYCLTIEPNTAFYKKNLKGLLDLPDEDRQVQMYEMAMDATQAAGLAQYEISNFAKPGLECAHNLCYWRHEPYAGYGPGAVGCMDGANVGETGELGSVRYTNLKHPERYCAAVESSSQVPFEHERLTNENVHMERVMLGIRLNEGLPISNLELDGAALEALRSKGWIDVDDDRLTLTRAGRHYCSEVALALS